MGHRAYPRLQEAPDPVDLALIALLPETCVQAMRDCAEQARK